MARLTPEQKRQIDDRICQEGLNEFGDPRGTVYAGGTPLFNMMTGQTIDRYDYIRKRHPGWVVESD